MTVFRKNGMTIHVSWMIGIRLTDGTKKTLGPEDMILVRSGSKDGIVSELLKGRADPGFHVKTQWRETGSGLRLGTLSCSGGSFYVETLYFPVISMPLPEDVRCLEGGATQGRIDVFPPDKPECDMPPVPMVSMQFTAALSGGKGVYLDFRDGKCRLKKNQWSRKAGRLIGRGIHPVPRMRHPGRRVSLGFECCVTVFRGDWYEAAMIYREWALTSPFFRRALRKKKNPLRDIGVWAWNRGSGRTVSEPVIRLSQDAGVPAALDWYWWHSCPYDTDYPEFWPPREGVKEFKRVLKRLRENGVYVQVYVNGMAWDIDSPGFPHGGTGSVIVREDGTPYAVEFNHYTRHRLGFCCGEGIPFQKRLEALVKKLTDAGLPGVYLDMIGCALFSPCFNPAHTHPGGGGDYHVTGYRKFMKSLRKKHPGILFSTEDCGEPFLDLFDSFIVLASSMERCGYIHDCVPAFSAVYHGTSALFGNYALMDGIPPWDSLWPADDRWKPEEEEPWEQVFPDQFCCELARTVIWGMQPTVCGLTMEQTEPGGRYAAHYRFLVMLCRFYYENREFLFDGRMLDPSGFETGEVTVGFLQRGIFTRKHEAGRLYRKLPAIFHSLWESPDGKRALIVVNYTGSEQSFAWKGIRRTMPSRSAEKILIRG